VCSRGWTNAWRRSGNFLRPPGWEGPWRDTSSGLAPKAEPRNEILLPRWTTGLPSGLVPSHRASHSRTIVNGLAEPVRTPTAPAAGGFRSVAETFHAWEATRPGGRTHSEKQPPHRDLGSNRVEERVREAPGGEPFPKIILTSQSPCETVRTRKAADSDDFEGLSVRGESGLPNPKPRLRAPRVLLRPELACCWPKPVRFATLPPPSATVSALCPSFVSIAPPARSS